MKDHSIAVSASLLFHVIIVALFLRVPFDQYIKPKIMTLDFSLEKGQAAESGEEGKSRISNIEYRIENPKPKTGNLEEEREKQTTEKRNTMIKPEENPQKSSVVEPSMMKREGLTNVVADPAGQVTVRREAAPVGARSSHDTDKQVPAGGDVQRLSSVSGSSRAIDYGKGASVANDFSFIDDTINKRFKDRYPDRARRMGWEGEVLLSFVVSEDGTIRDVKVVKSSGHNVFDDHAREIIAKTTFDRRLPYPRTIDNWRVTYQLH